MTDHPSKPPIAPFVMCLFVLTLGSIYSFVNQKKSHSSASLLAAQRSPKKIQLQNDFLEKCQKKSSSNSSDLIWSDQRKITEHRDFVSRSNMAWNDLISSCYGDLHLRLTDGREQILSDIFDRHRPDQWLFHQFHSYLSNIGFYIVTQRFYEGSGALLISRDTGIQYHVFPHHLLLSPQDDFLASWSTDLVTRYDPTGLDLWKVEKGKLIRVYRLSSLEWGPSHVFWQDHRTLVFSKVKQINGLVLEATGENGAKLPPSCLTLEQDQWQLREPCSSSFDSQIQKVEVKQTKAE